MKKLFIVIDFDGTIVSSRYPTIGTLQYKAVETISSWYHKGHTIIISTCRAGQMADDAYAYLIHHNIPFHCFNENPRELIELYGTDTRKASGDVYFDDKSAGGFMGWEKADEYVKQMEQQKPVVICIIGESGSGKTVLAEYIETRFAVNMIESYTDRPKRKPNEQGHTFLSKDEFDKLSKDEMIAWTKFGDYRYCCLESDVKSQNTYVIDEDGLLLLMSKYRAKYEIYSVRIKCDEIIRRMRAGDERVNRDQGVFTLTDNYYNFVLDTTNQEVNNYPVELIQTIAKWLGRGWNY